MAKKASKKIPKRKPGRQNPTPTRPRSTGAAEGNRNSLAHGMYSKALLPGEEFLELRTDLTEEIKIAKLRLRRAVLQEKLHIDALESGDEKQMEQFLRPSEVEYVEQLGGEEGGTFTRNRVVKKIDNIGAVIHNIINQLVKLVAQQQALDGGGGELTPQQRAEKAREFLRKAREDADADPDSEEGEGGS